jgi:hypothetical protein
MTQVEAKFVIAKARHEVALKKLKELTKRTDLMGGSMSDGRGVIEKYFSWVSTAEVLGAVSLSNAMRAFRWAVELDAEGNITAICFVGEKLGDDEHFFGAIAEFVDDGSFVEMLGEDGSSWRWIFSGGKFAVKRGPVSWD